MTGTRSEVQVDTPEIRVTQWRLVPGSATGHHIHEMDYGIVPVTVGEMTIVAPDGNRSKASLAPANPISARRAPSEKRSMKSPPKPCSWKWSRSRNLLFTESPLI